MRRIHCLKTWPEYFEAVRQGIKGFEFRKDDRNFEVGDILVLQEFRPGFPTLSQPHMTINAPYEFDEQNTYTGKQHCVEITYKSTDAPGLPEGYCLLGTKELDDGGMFPDDATERRITDAEKIEKILSKKS